MMEYWCFSHQGGRNARALVRRRSPDTSFPETHSRRQNKKNKQTNKQTNKKKNLVGPVGAEGELAEVGKGLLRRSVLALPPRQLVRELDHEPAKAAPLVGRQGQNARQIVPLVALLLFREVANNVRPVVVVLGQHIETERLHVKVKRLVVKEELGQQAQVLRGCRENQTQNLCLDRQQK